MPGRVKSCALLLVFTAVLSYAYVTDPFAIDSSNRFETLSGIQERLWPVEDRPVRGLVYSDADILASIEHYHKDPPFAEPAVIFRAHGKGYYYSQFALQRLVYSTIVPADAPDVTRYVAAFATLNAVLLGSVLGLFCFVVYREFGIAPAFMVLALLALSDWLLAFSIGLFYVAWLRFLPFVLCWFLLQSDRNHRPTPRLYLAVMLSVMVAALCGYDYITNVVVATAIPAFYYGWRGSLPVTQWLRGAAYCVSAGVAGLALAMLGHAVALSIHFGSIARAIGVFIERARFRMAMAEDVEVLSSSYDRMAERALSAVPILGDALKEALGGYLPHIRPFFLWLRYLVMDAVTVPLVPGFEIALPIVFFLLVSVAVFAYGYTIQRRQSHPQDPLYILAGVACIGFLISNLWTILFLNHMKYHAHLNAIIFYIPFLLVAYTLVAVLLQHAIARVQLLLPRAL